MYIHTCTTWQQKGKPKVKILALFKKMAVIFTRQCGQQLHVLPDTLPDTVETEEN